MFSLTHHLPKLLIKPLIHHIAVVIEQAVVVISIGVAGVELPKGLLRLWIIANYLPIAIGI